MEEPAEMRNYGFAALARAFDMCQTEGGEKWKSLQSLVDGTTFAAVHLVAG